MSTLHTVNKSPFTNGALLSCIKHVSPGDAVLLIEDGVYGALSGSSVAAEVGAAIGDVSVLALSGDVDARGISGDKIMDGVKTVDYGGFVDLVAEHDRTQSWL